MLYYAMQTRHGKEMYIFISLLFSLDL